MKKVLSIVLAMMLVVALAVPSMAASKADLLAMADKVPAGYQSMVKDAVNAMTDAEAQLVKVDDMKAVAKDAYAKVNAGTLTYGDIDTYVKNANVALNGAATIDPKSVSTGIDTATGKVSVTAKVTTASGTVANVNVAANMPAAGSTTGTTGGSSVIKKTGASMADAALVMALAVAGVLGCAVVKARKVA